MRSEQVKNGPLPPVGRSELAADAKYYAFRTLARARRLLAGRLDA